jgi:hypothetical protein
MTATQDSEAERALIGACLVADSAIEAALPIVTSADFVPVRHQLTWDAIVALYRAGSRADVVSVGAALPSGAVEPGYLHELQNNTPSISSAARYATVIADASVRRRLIHAAGDIVALANGDSTATDAADAAAQARQLLADIDMPEGQGDPDPDVDTWLAGIDTSYDWLFPDFLERGDRMLVTAGEGGGKSTLLRQIAMQGACGIHPWNLTNVPPFNVTIIDCENGEKMAARSIASLRRKAGEIAKDRFDPARLRVHIRPAGVDITSTSGRRWLTDRISANRPDLLVIGPTYKLQKGAAEKNDIGGEAQAKAVVEVLDDLRDRFGITLLMEAHAPHGGQAGKRDLRPRGSAVWLAWPEFGLGIDKHPKERGLWTLQPWRGPRDTRTWPQGLTRDGRWPWTARMGTGTFNTPTMAELPPIDAYDDVHLLGGPTPP